MGGEGKLVKSRQEIKVVGFGGGDNQIEVKEGGKGSIDTLHNVEGRDQQCRRKRGKGLWFTYLLTSKYAKSASNGFLP